MGTIKKSNFMWKGRVGLNTASIVHGVNIVKSLPANVYNPRTALQMDNRERFKTLAQLAAAFLAPSNIGLKNKAKQFGPLVTAFDAFVKVNQGAVSVMGGEAEVDYGSLKCSVGNLPQAGFGNASFAAPITLPFARRASLSIAPTFHLHYAPPHCARRFGRREKSAFFSNTQSNQHNIK